MDRATKRRLKQEGKQRKKEERARRKQNRKPSVMLKELGNLPNMLTLGRIAVIPLFVWFTYDADPMYSLLAAGIFALASITDVVDGFLARRWNQITVTGKLLDPLADKLIVMAAMVMMTRLGRLPAWVVIVLLGRELIVMGLRQIAASEGLVIAAGQEGKWKTSLQLVGIIALCVHYTHPVELYVTRFDCDFNSLGQVLVYASTFFSVWSAGGYFKAFFNTLSAHPRNT
jgi:CDP-diacylglycerol--glycerol-3-phosphate 3-phosphatidyltransferase